MFTLRTGGLGLQKCDVMEHVTGHKTAVQGFGSQKKALELICYGALRHTGIGKVRKVGELAAWKTVTDIRHDGCSSFR